MPSIQLAVTDEEIARCFPVMRQLRPHLHHARFVATVRAQEEEGYRMVYREQDGRVEAVAGFRVYGNLVGGRILYVDDLVTEAEARSRGHGKALLD